MGNRKLLNAGNEERKSGMKGLKVLEQKAIKRFPKSWAMEKTSVDAECNVARSAGRQGE